MLDMLKTGAGAAANPYAAAAGVGLQVLSGVGKIIGAGKQRKQAKKALGETKDFFTGQKGALSRGYTGLLDIANQMETFTGDLSGYDRTEQEAQMGKRMASGGQIAGEGIMREQARQTTANTLAAARQGAGSGSDLLTAALMGQQQEGAQMQNIDLQVGQQRQQMQQQAQQNYLNSLGQTAAARLSTGQLEFQSRLAKQSTLLGLGQSKLGAEMDLAQNAFNAQQAAAASVANATAAMWGGGADVLGTIGSGLTGMASQNTAMANYLKMRGTTPSNESNPFGIVK